MLPEIINNLRNTPFTQDQAYRMQISILHGQANTEELLQIFQIFEDRQITEAEFMGFLQASRDNMMKIFVDYDVLDIVGTGGDGLDTFNVSTLAGIVCASGGVKVAKHGGRSASGKCGSADVLEYLGVNLELTAEQARERMERQDFIFCWAPRFNPAFRYVRDARNEFGKPTYFNLLGPQLNPASSNYMVFGVSEKIAKITVPNQGVQTPQMQMLSAIGYNMVQTGCEKIWIVQGEDGMDEVSTSSITKILEFSYQNPRGKLFQLDPRNYGFNFYPVKDLICHDVASSAEIFMNVLENKASPAQMTAVILNAAAGLTVSGKCDTIRQSLDLARNLLQSGKALEMFNQVKV